MANTYIQLNINAIFAVKERYNLLMITFVKTFSIAFSEH